MTAHANVVSPGSTLRSLMDTSVVAAPGAFNALCGLAIKHAGFPAAYVSGAATSVSAGVPDVGLVGIEQFCRAIREIHQATGLPVLADADTGFGEAEMVRKTVIEYSLAGAAGLHIEDQVFPKRCGHLDGKQLLPSEHMCEKVQWAKSAAKAIGDGGFVICARTDARAGEGLQAAIDRAQAYIKAGADMIFPEGLASEAEFEAFAKAINPDGSDATTRRAYLLANMTEFGKTPIIPLARFGEMGYHIVIFPVSLLRVAMHAVTGALTMLKTEGSVSTVLNSMQTRQQLYQLIGYTPGVSFESRVR